MLIPLAIGFQADSPPAGSGVSGDRLHTPVERERIGDHLLELRFTSGVAAYAFTFG